MRKVIQLVFMLLPLFGVKAQDAMSFTLEQAKAYAVENSYFTKQAIMDEEIAAKRVRETASIGMPQVSAEGAFQRFIEIPTTVVPANAFDPEAPADQFQELKFGTDYNITGTLKASQLIFDGSYIVGLQAARAYKDFAEKNRVKSEVDIKESVTTAYANAVIASENVATIQGNLKYLEQTLAETRELHQQGFAEEQDVDQIKILVASAKNQYDNAKRLSDISTNVLKFQMGIEVGKTIEVTDNLESILAYGSDNTVMTQKFDYNRHIDYQLSLSNEKLQALNLRNKQAAFLPTLAGFFQHQEVYQANDLKIGDNKWFPTTIVGLNLNVPIFSSFGKRYAMQQAQIDLNKAQLSSTMAQEQLTLNYLTSKSNYEFAVGQYENSKENFDLIKRIVDKEITKYNEGVSTSLNLANTQIQFFDIQGGYIGSIQRLIEAKTSLDKALNNL